MKYFISMLILSLTAFAGEPSYLVKQRVLGSGAIETLAVELSERNTENALLLKDTVEYIDEHHSHHGANKERYQEWLIPKSELNEKQRSRIAVFSPALTASLPHLEVRAILEQGPPKNRINLPILAEGYTLNERDKFFNDAARITKDLFGHKAFSSYIELFNVYAIFVASDQSGVTDIQRKKTAFGLYRSPQGSKRGILPSNTYLLEQAFKAAPGADYPIILVNDDYYGGLGGRYAITTRSLTSGSMVLRHELGHNFGRVGEEYDGGGVYEGANFSRDGKRPKWSHWIEGETKVFETKFLQGAYVWKNMKNRDIDVNFNFPRGDYKLDLKISSVGWSRPDEVSTKLNGKELPIYGLYTKDRSFFYPQKFIPLQAGEHKLSFKDLSKDGDNVFAFAMVYAQPNDLIAQKGFVGSYAVYDSYRRKRGYRPTYETCIMRNMRSNEFCSADKENMWQRFLQKVNILDSVNFEALEDNTTGIRIKRATSHGAWSIEGFDRAGNKIFTSKYLDRFRVNKQVDTVRVNFRTPEVRKYTQNFSKSFKVKH